ncbi:MAG: AMP-binding protein [Pseudomonadota bacterium]
MLSYSCGTSRLPLRYQGIGQAFDEAVASHGGRDALLVPHQGVHWSYEALACRVETLAAGLVAHGLQPGERVGIWAPNCAQWVLAQLACAKAGLILVTINPAYRLGEVEYALNKVGCKALILAERFKSSDYVAMMRRLAPEARTCPPGALMAKRLPALKSLIVIAEEAPPGFLRFDDILAMADDKSRVRLNALGSTLSPDDAINIQFTSGTTGAPKGATLTHHNILNNGFFVAEGMGLTPADRLCIPVPLYHCFGMVMGVLGCITHGAAMVFPGPTFDPGATLACIAQAKCTALYGVPTMFIAMLDHADFARHDLSTLRTGVMAGAPCPAAVMRRVINDMHMREVTICYGMTETSPVSFQTHANDPLAKRVASVGRAHPFIEAKIVDESGRILARGQQGELLVRGYSVMRGYWGDEARTAEAVDAGGWMHTGDLAIFDEDGYCAITGRLKDMIIRGGENIYPREVEEFLYRHPKIQDVQVFGVADEKFGEEVCAWIVLKPGQTMTADDVMAYCRDAIAHYKAPRHIRFVDAFPMTVTGKAQKFIMREAMAKALGRVPAMTA